MPDCIHIWQGDSKGVVCLCCGKRLTRDEFIAWITPSPAAEKRKTSKKKEVKA